MTARKARKLTYKNNAQLKSELESIYEMIQEKCNDGETELCLSPITTQSIIDHLNFDLGYTIETEEESKSGIVYLLKIKW